MPNYIIFVYLALELYEISSLNDVLNMILFTSR